MAGSYLEQFLETIQALPLDLNRNLTLVRTLDGKVEDIVKSINSKAEYYLTNSALLSKEEKTQIFQQISELYEKAFIDSENKRELVHQTYNLVDKHIRSLDSELAKLDNELGESSRNSSGETPEKGDGKKRAQKVVKLKAQKSSLKLKEKLNSEKNRKRVAESISKEAKSGETKKKSVLPPTDLLDMEVDPNEPRYCICHQVSFGEMVGCDEADCPIEWFHFQCVGLTSKPKGKWFCPQCTLKKKSRQTQQ